MSHRAYRFYLPALLRSRPRLFTAMAAGIIGFAVLPASLSLSIRGLIGWDILVALYLSLAFTMMSRGSKGHIRHRAQQEQTGRFFVLGTITAAASASLLAIFKILGGLKDMPEVTVNLHLALACFTVISSWLLVQTLFAQIYAHEYYREPDQDGVVYPLNFPDDEEPDYWDFLYFATIIGMTSQVSDVAIRGRLVRRIATAHGILSFFFNTGILALAINIAASLL